jgi:hypothetical protein
MESGLGKEMDVVANRSALFYSMVDAILLNPFPCDRSRCANAQS